ncbi:MAG TPA: hypothetical protein VJ783_30415 [Pirellulales bacterium]|nr:hypothetical protein [Pirellulales bacterium]
MKNNAVSKKTVGSKRKRGIEARAGELLAHAKNAARTTTDWMEVFNSVFAPGAVFAKLFPSEQERLEFMQTTAHQELYELLWKLQDQYGDREATPPELASGALLIEVPRALRAALNDEAKEQGVSLNVLCVAKLAMKLGKQAPRSPRRQAS